MMALISLKHLGKRLVDMRNNAGAPGEAAIDGYAQAMSLVEAMRLIELGARASLVCQLTGMPKAAAKRLYRQINGHASPPGQAPFTDTWYLQSDWRMLHANIVYRLSKKLRTLERGRAQTLISVYEGYRRSVLEPLLTLTQVEFVPHLLNMRIWRERVCEICEHVYVGPITDVEIICPACRIQRLYRCTRCGGPLKPKTTGRRAELCANCRHDAQRV